MSMQVRELDGWVRGKLTVGREVARRDHNTNRFIILGRVSAIEQKSPRRKVARLSNGNGCSIGKGLFWSRE